jgi:hypothetical protein
MRAFLVAVAVLGVIAATAAVGSTQSKPSNSSIQGAWKLTEVVRTGANPITNKSPQPSLYLFTARHFSIMSDNGTEPRKARTPAKDSAQLTQADKLAAFAEWDLVTANAGTYEIKGTTLTRRPLIAKNVTVMTNPPTVGEFQVSGNTLVLTNKSAAGQPASETRLTLTRVE